MFGIPTSSDEISGRAAWRISPRVSAPRIDVAGIEGAIGNPDLSGEGCAETRSWLGSGVVRLSETGVATGAAGDGSGDRCATSGPAISTREGMERSAAGIWGETRGIIRSEAAVSGTWLGAENISVSEIPRTSTLGATDCPLRDSSGDRDAVEDARCFPGDSAGDAMFGVAIASDRTSGCTAGRISPRTSALGLDAGTEGAVRALTPSVTSRGGIDSDGAVLVSLLAET